MRVGTHQCAAHSSRTGERCRRPSILGGTVCTSHGGSTKRAKQKAEERLRAMVDPLLSQLFKIALEGENDGVKLAATRDALDRAGFKAVERIEADNAVTIRVEYETLEQSPARVIEHHYEQLQNGATNGQSKAKQHD